MTPAEAAELQVALEGVDLPAEKRDLVEHVRAQLDGERYVAQLAQLPDREYRSLDEVGEALLPVQPNLPATRLETPKPESGQPPGGDDYTNPDPESGEVQPD